MDLVLAATDATPDEAQQLVEILRPEAKTSLGGLIRLMAENGDLTHRLWRLRRQRASEGRTEASGGARPAVCGLHGCQLPCGPCRGDLNAGGECAQRVVDMYAGLGADAAALRPDVAGHPVIRAALAVTG
ncbi:hypothetical protein EMG21_27620 [Klebsiella pneumoniae]|nr:hypothetical protein EMG21_27620 [Klebsiella pneumoniae]